MTPEQVRTRVDAIAPLAQTDPVTWHVTRNRIHADVLHAIAAGAGQPEALARAALAADQHQMLWAYA